MSKANGAIEQKNTFLQHVSLKNYRSIRDIKINFQPGLNIIIGKNASGKTNFINGLSSILNYRYNEIFGSEFAVKAFFKDDIVVIKKQMSAQLSKKNFNSNHHNLLKNNDVIIEINDEKINTKDAGFHYAPIYALSERGLYFDRVLIKYGVSYKITDSFINVPFSLTIVNNGIVSSDLLLLVMADDQTRFVGSFLEYLNKSLYEIYGTEKKVSIPENDLKDKIISFSSKHFSNINAKLSKYSPIETIRLNPDFNIIKEDGGQKQTITNFYIEFLIDKTWLTFNLLSDGTKRLFYILSEMLSTYNDENVLDNTDLNIILLEEPELGIHPHQLHQLMQFIKEQATEKQIIITTHSPQVLDVLDPDELDRVIICHNDLKKGTQLNHLNEKEIKKAKKYMKEESFLSDYWRFSDLEPA